MPTGRRKVAIVGAGAVGSALAHRCLMSGHRVVAVVSRTARRSNALGRQVRARVSGTSLRIIPPDVDTIIIAVPDASIRAVAASLAATELRLRGVRVVHTSGLQTSDALVPAFRSGARIASIHPIFPFTHRGRPRDAAKRLAGATFGVEAPARDRGWARSFVRSLGGSPLDVPKQRKTLYHAACTFASNYALTLLESTRELSAAARLGRRLGPFERLFLTTVHQAFRTDPMSALTGPVVRGDDAAVSGHARALRKHARQLVPLFDALVRATARHAVRSKRLRAPSARRVVRSLSQRPRR